jgi:hypothetical protein
MSVAGSENRRFMRHPTSIPITCRMTGHEKASESEMQNVSFGGLAFVSEQKYNPGDLVDLTFPSLRNRPTINGQIVWTRTVGTNGNTRYVDGLRFRDERSHFRARLVEQISHIESYCQVQRRLGRQIDIEGAAREWIEKYAARFPQ